MLTQSLRRMGRDGLVTRQVFAEVPPRVEYTLTELGHSLAKSAVKRPASGKQPVIGRRPIAES